MATGDERTNFEDKRNLPQQRVKDTFFDYLLARLQEISQRVWGGQRGVFGSLILVSAGNDKFSVQTLPGDLLDGDGNILTLDGTDGTSIQFENTVSTTYYVAAKYTTVPSGVLRNPRNNVIFYDTEVDAIGERDEPDAVTEVSGTLEIQVDSIFESSVSHAGRLVTVFLKRPLTIDESVAIETDLVVQWTGSVNKVVTTGLLGQAGGSASNSVSDYEVVAQGVTVRKSDLSTVDPYAYVGSVTGGGAGSPPAGFSTAGQIDVSDGINPDLQEAYTVGRTITPSSTYGGAVKISSLDSGDELNAVLHLDRRGSTESTPVNVANLLDSNGVGQLNLYPISHSTGDLLEDEAAQIVASPDGTVNLTRGGVSASGSYVRRDCDLVLLQGFSTSDVNGLHVLASDPGTTQIVVSRFDGGSMAGYWSGASGETGTASFIRIGLGVSKMPVGSGTAPQFGAPISINGTNEADDTAAVRIYPRQAENALECYEGRALSPRLQALLTRWGTFEGRCDGESGAPYNELFKSARFGNTDYFQVGYLAEMGDVSAVPFAAVQPQSTTTYLEESENVTLSGDVVTFTRGGVDLTYGDPDVISVRSKLLLLYDADEDADEGLFVISAKAATYIQARRPDGSTPSFAGTNAKARILCVRFLLANKTPFVSSYAQDLVGTILGLEDGAQNAAPVIFHPMAASAANLIQFLDRGNAGTPEVATQWGMILEGSYYHPKWRFGNASGVGGNPVLQGVEFNCHPGGAADDFAVNFVAAEARDSEGETGFNRAVGFHDENGNEVARFEQWGSFARTTEIFDDFFWTAAPPTSLWTVSTIGSSAVNWNSTVGHDQGGYATCVANGSTNDYAKIEKYRTLYIRHGTASPTVYRIVHLSGRLKFTSNTQVKSRVYLEFKSDFKVGVYYYATSSATSIQFFSEGTSGTNYSSGIGTPPTAAAEYGWFQFKLRLDLESNTIDFAYFREWDGAQGMGSIAFRDETDTDWEGTGTLAADCETLDGSEKHLDVDWVRVRDEVLKSGPKDRNS